MKRRWYNEWSKHFEEECGGIALTANQRNVYVNRAPLAKIAIAYVPSPSSSRQPNIFPSNEPMKKW
jgi:hypothetical protein